MVVVDSSVWIDFFRNASTPQVGELSRLLDSGDVRLVLPDLVYYEVLRGFRAERDLRQARQLMRLLSLEICGGESAALAAAEHYRALRSHGITVRSSVDVLVAGFCIERDYLLLHADRDFDAFETHRGLRVWRH